MAYKPKETNESNAVSPSLLSILDVMMKPSTFYRRKVADLRSLVPPNAATLWKPALCLLALL